MAKSPCRRLPTAEREAVLPRPEDSRGSGARRPGARSSRHQMPGRRAKNTMKEYRNGTLLHGPRTRQAFVQHRSPLVPKSVTKIGDLGLKSRTKLVHRKMRTLFSDR